MIPLEKAMGTVTQVWLQVKGVGEKIQVKVVKQIVQVKGVEGKLQEKGAEEVGMPLGQVGLGMMQVKG